MLNFALIAEAAAENDGNQGGATGMLLQMAPIFLIMIVIMFFMARGNKKQQMQRQMMLDQITKGSEVLLSSGIYGKVVEVHQDDFMVEISDGTVIKVVKAGIANVIVEEEAKTK